MVIQGYTPKQLQYGTGGPKQIENLYTRTMLEETFRDVKIVEEEVEMHEGTSHGGCLRVINLRRGSSWCRGPDIEFACESRRANARSVKKRRRPVRACRRCRWTDEFRSYLLP